MGASDIAHHPHTGPSRTVGADFFVSVFDYMNASCSKLVHAGTTVLRRTDERLRLKCQLQSSISSDEMLRQAFHTIARISSRKKV